MTTEATTATINPAANTFLVNLMGPTRAAAFEAVAENSPTFVSLIDDFANGNHGAVPNIISGVAGRGTSTAAETITVDPNWIPGSGSTSAESYLEFATTLGRELGHATKPQGETNYTGIDSVAAAVIL